MKYTIKAGLPKRFDMHKLGEEIAAVSGRDIPFSATLDRETQEMTEFTFEIPPGARYDHKAIEAAVTGHALAEHEPDERQKAEVIKAKEVDVATRLEALEARVLALEGKAK